MSCSTSVTRRSSPERPAEVTHLRSVDRIVIGDGSMGPITTAIHDEFFALVNGKKADRYNWLTPVNVKVPESVGV